MIRLAPIGVLAVPHILRSDVWKIDSDDLFGGLVYQFKYGTGRLYVTDDFGNSVRLDDRHLQVVFAYSLDRELS